MKNLDLEVCEHSPSAATTSQIASVQKVCDPFQAATGSPHSVLFGAWILLRPACNSMRRRIQECLFLVLLHMRARGKATMLHPRRRIVLRKQKTIQALVRHLANEQISYARARLGPVRGAVCWRLFSLSPVSPLPSFSFLSLLSPSLSVLFLFKKIDLGNYPAKPNWLRVDQCGFGGQFMHLSKSVIGNN